MGTFRFDRLEKIYDSRESALDKLNTITFDYAEAAVVRYRKNSELYILLVIGNGSGYEIIADSVSFGESGSEIPGGGKVYIIQRPNDSKTDLELIEEEVGNKIPEGGDVSVISTIVDGEIFDRIAYIYNDDTKYWEPITGKVDANKVILNDDIQLSGNYTSIGNLNKSDGVWRTKGKSVWEAFNELLDKTVDPIVSKEPKVVLEAIKTGLVEVGSTIQQGYNLKFTDGEYNAGGIIEKIEANISNTVIKYGNENWELSQGETKDIKVEENFSKKFTGEITVTTKNFAENNKGETTELIWENGEKVYEISSSTLNSYREGIFYGTVTSKITNWESSNEINNTIRSLEKTGKDYSATTLNFTLKKGSTQIIVAWNKKDNRKGLVEVIDVTNNEAISLGNFNTHIIQISGADNIFEGSQFLSEYIVMEYAPISGEWLKDINIQLKFE